MYFNYQKSWPHAILTSFVIVGVTVIVYGADAPSTTQQNRESETTIAVLRAARDATMESFRSGSMSIRLLRSKIENGKALEMPVGRMDVVFDGPKFVGHQYFCELPTLDDANAPEKFVLSRSLLGADGKLTQYTTGKGPERGPRAVIIDKIQRRGEKFPTEWSLHALADIPSPVGWNFGQLSQKLLGPYGKIDRMNTVVRASIIDAPPRNSGIKKAEVFWTFDLQLGGMLTEYTRVYNEELKSRATGTLEMNEMTVSHKYTWVYGEDKVLRPTSMVIEVTYKNDGKIVLYQNNQLEFLDVSLEPVDSRIFNDLSLNILEGTPVQDAIIGRNRKYVK